MNRTSIVLREVLPNGARVGEVFQLLFQQEWRGKAERQAPFLPEEQPRCQGCLTSQTL